MKKIFIIFFCLILTIIFFHNFFITNIIQFKLEKITEKKVKIESININFKNQELTIRNIAVLNDQKFEYKNIFFCDEIILEFNFLNLFQEVIFFNKIIFKNPIMYVEIKKNDLIFEDNISVLDKTKKSYNPKIYPKKNRDRNVIFKKVLIINPKANLIVGNLYRYENFNLSNINFSNVGTSTDKSLHFKKIFEIILSDLYLRVPNFEIKKKLKDIYKSK
ncbi:hypothetical protein OAX12_03325 [Candidatus Pelagibacter sp.]|nr:hypothetical protein [Candidatus Pelagibacter sp.]